MDYAANLGLSCFGVPGRENNKLSPLCRCELVKHHMSSALHFVDEQTCNLA